MSTQQLVTTTAGPLALPPVIDETGLSDLVRLKPTNLILVQPTTRDPKTAKPGQILDKVTGEVYSKVKVVILKTKAGRVMFPPGADLDAEPICRSDNGVVPSEFAKAKQSNFCSTCPQSQWVGGQKPPCQSKINNVAVMTNTDMPHYITVGGASTPTFTEGLQNVQRKIFLAKKLGQIKNLHNFELTLEGAVGKGKGASKGRFFTWNITEIAELGEDDVAKYTAFFNEMNAITKEQQELVNAEGMVDAAVGEIVDGEVVVQEV